MKLRSIMSFIPQLSTHLHGMVVRHSDKFIFTNLINSSTYTSVPGQFKPLKSLCDNKV